MKEKYIEDLEQIKKIMNRSTRFISLSGLSGISTGIIALIGVFIAHILIFKDQQYLTYDAVDLGSSTFNILILTAIGALIFSIVSAIFFTQRKTTKQNMGMWDKQTKRLLINLSIPLITGGLLCLMLMIKGFIGLLPPLTLIFYGLALVNGSKYTLSEIRNLGIIVIVLGLLSVQFIEYGLLFWALGFGVVQIIYGLVVQKRYK